MPLCHVAMSSMREVGKEGHCVRDLVLHCEWDAENSKVVIQAAIMRTVRTAMESSGEGPLGRRQALG